MTKNFCDFGDVYEQLNKLRNLERDENKIMNKIAPIVAEDFEKVIPVWNGDKSKMVGTRGAYMKEHMRDHVIYSKAKNGMVEVGFDDEVDWRVHFTEYGTINQRPQLFMEKFIEKEQDKVRGLVFDEINKSVGL